MKDSLTKATPENPKYLGANNRKREGKNMAYHTTEYPMTAKEAKEHYKYMQPHGVYCDGQRIKEKDYDKYIVDYVEVRSGIVYYFTHKATEN